MKRIAVAVALITLLVAGCTATAEPVAGGEKGVDTDAEQRTIDIYAAIIRRLVTKDHTFGTAPSPFERVYVVDGVAAGVDDRTAVTPATVEPFGPAVRAGILRELRDLPPVEFVSDPGSVVSGEKRCARVTGSGALITLGPISGEGENVSVPSDLFFGCLGALRLNYVLERAVDGGWQVVGTKGPIVIS